MGHIALRMSSVESIPSVILPNEDVSDKDYLRASGTLESSSGLWFLCGVVRETMPRLPVACDGQHAEASLINNTTVY